MITRRLRFADVDGAAVDLARFDTAGNPVAEGWWHVRYANGGESVMVQDDMPGEWQEKMRRLLRRGRK